MKTLLCGIGRLENSYIREWVEHYKKLGFTNICLFDNNKPDEEHFEDVIGDYIDSGFVILKDYRGRETCQLQAYTDCYTEYGNEYDWIAFFDCDEFLTLVKNNTIEQYLKRIVFKNAEMIHINWMNHGDGDKVYKTDEPLLQRITKPCKYDYTCEYKFPENYHIKSIVKGSLENFVWRGNPHTPGIVCKCVNASGQNKDSRSPFSPYNYTDAYLKHFTTKTAEEYANKMLRGFPDQSYESHKTRIKMLIETRFFKTNEITKEKVDLFKEKLNVDMSYLLPKSEHIEGKSDDVKIYSLCYSKKDFKFLDDKVITPLQVGAANGTDVCELKDNTGENISSANFFYIENTGTYWIWKNVHGCKYKGQMQYRRPLEGINEDTDFDAIFKEYDVITCEPFNHPLNSKPSKENNFTYIPAQTVEEGYKFSNNGRDIEILEEVIKSDFPEYSEAYDRYIKNGENLYYSSGYVMRESDFDKWSEFLFDVINKWLGRVGITNQLDLYYYLGVCAGQGYLKRKLGDDPIHYNKGSVKWESEIGGFLGERIWTLWLQKNFDKDKIYTRPYIKMEEGMYT